MFGVRILPCVVYTPTQIFWNETVDLSRVREIENSVIDTYPQKKLGVAGMMVSWAAQIALILFKTLGALVLRQAGLQPLEGEMNRSQMSAKSQE